MGGDYEDLAEEAIRLTTALTEAHGSRVSGSPGGDGPRAELKALLERHCSRVDEEAFPLHPEALYSIGKVFALVYAIGLAAILIGGAWGLGIGLAAMLLGTAFFILQFILYRDAFDRLFKELRGANLVGAVEPEGEARRQAIVVGHLDSARIYSFYERQPGLFPLRLLLAVLSFFFCLFALAAGLAQAASGLAGPMLPAWARGAAAFGALFALPMYGYVSKMGSPGAGDNLIGCAIGLALAEMFGLRGARLRETRLIFLFTDGEESGQKGAKAFIRDNEALLRSLPTRVVNVDSIYQREDLALLRRDRNGLTPLSGRLSEELREAAKSRGHDFALRSIPFCGGGTDAAQFARAGLETASVIGMPIEANRKDILFHTSRDLPAAISVQAVAAVIETIALLLARSDKGYPSPAPSGEAAR
jgi:aminopeptidase YwaD